jgi:hypothetical protein
MFPPFALPVRCLPLIDPQEEEDPAVQARQSVLIRNCRKASHDQSDKSPVFLSSQ